MKLKILALLIMVLLVFTGCSVRKTVRTLDAAEEAVEQRLDHAEDAVEKAIRDAATSTQPPAAPAPADPEELISPEESLEIALAKAGFTADQVSRLRTEFEYDDRIPQYEVSFREGRWEYEFQIHAETGEILSWEKDR